MPLVETAQAKRGRERERDTMAVARGRSDLLSEYSPIRQWLARIIFPPKWPPPCANDGTQHAHILSSEKKIHMREWHHLSSAAR